MKMQPEELACLVRSNIRYYRKLHHVTQVQLAERIGTTQDHISDIERGDTKPTMDMLAKISDALGIPPHVLVSQRETTELTASP